MLIIFHINGKGGMKEPNSICSAFPWEIYGGQLFGIRVL